MGRWACIAWLVCTGPMLHAEDWPRWRGPRGDSTWKGPELPDTLPAELPVAWKQPIGGGYGGIAVADQRLYVMDRQKEPAEVERVLCVDADTGRSLWSHSYPVTYGKLDYGNGPRATPTVHAGLVYTLGAVGHVFCLDARTGEVRWSKDLVKDFGAKIPEWGLAASPFIWEDLVVFHPGAANGACWIAFDRLTGNEAWRAGNDPAGYATPTLAISPSGPQLIAWSPEHVVGIAPRTGRILWEIPYKVTYGVSIATPLYRDGLVLVAGYWEGSKAIELGPKPTDAHIAWEDSRVLRGLMAPPLYRQGFVYLLDKQYGLTCFELKTGKKLWDDENRMTPRGRNPQASLVWLGDSDRVLILNSEGELILARLTPAGYDERSRTPIIGPTWAHPGFAGDRVFVRNDQELISIVLPAK